MLGSRRVDSRQVASLGELFALSRLLVEKGMIIKGDLLEIAKVVDREMKRKRGGDKSV
jgi:hypothetical protein